MSLFSWQANKANKWIVSLWQLGHWALGQVQLTDASLHCQVASTNSPLPSSHRGQLHMANLPWGQLTLGSWRKSWVGRQASRWAELRAVAMAGGFPSSHPVLLCCCHHTKLWAQEGRDGGSGVGWSGRWGGNDSWGHSISIHTPPPSLLPRWALGQRAKQSQWGISLTITWFT